MHFIKHAGLTATTLIAIGAIAGAVHLLGAGGVGWYFTRKQPTPEPTFTPVVQSHRSYTIRSDAASTSFQPKTASTYTFSIVDDQGNTLKDFATVHEKIMHLIVVRKDLQHFQHLHPSFDANSGTFTAVVTFPTNGPYRLFPDFTPAKTADNPQLLPVTVFTDVNMESEQRYQPQPVLADTETWKRVGGYAVTYAFPDTVRAQMPLTYSLDIAQNDRPVTDLEPYLGALGHSVILKAETLDFIHTHAEEREGQTRGPRISFSTTFPEPGLYKVFTQFQREGRVLTTEHVVSVEGGSGETKGAEHGGGHPMQ